MSNRKNLSIDDICEYIMDSGSEDESDSEESELNFSEINDGASNMHSDPSGVVDNIGECRPTSDCVNDNDDVVIEEPESDEENNMFVGPQNLYEWHNSTESRKFHPKLFNFDENKSGINNDLDLGQDCNESDCFKILFDKDLVSHIVKETNRYCNQYISNTVLKEKSKLQKWYNTNESEIYTFLATIMLMPHNKKNRILDYWSTDPLLCTPIFGRIFSQDRFINLLRMLHLDNNKASIKGDRLAKISTVLHTLRMKFKFVMIPFKNLCIDESLLQWKGRLSFKQYMPKKRHRFGVKLFILCDCKTGFVIDMVIYTGKQTNIEVKENLGISGSVVTTLTEPYLGIGHTVYVDNCYTSPYLFQYLHDNQTGAVGTARTDRKDMAKFPKLKSGDYSAKNTTCLLAEKWVDKKDVNMLSSIHTNEQKDSGKVNYTTHLPIRKPVSVIDYNKNMGLIDKSDMQISFTDSARKSSKWYKKLFYHLVDMTVYNAYIIYKMKTGKFIQLGQFRINLIRQLLEEFTPLRASPAGGRKIKNQDMPLRLTARHFPDILPPTEKNLKPRRACHVCKYTSIGPQKRQDTHWMCKDCDVPLCLPDCFRAYHTKKHF